MKITALETLRTEEFSNVLWVRVHTDSGTIGLGETFYGAEAVAAHIHETLADRLIGRNPLHIEALNKEMVSLPMAQSSTGVEYRAASAVDIALWDIFGKVCGQPVHQMLGGLCRDKLRIYNTCAGYRYVRSKNIRPVSNWNLGQSEGTVRGPRRVHESGGCAGGKSAGKRNRCHENLVFRSCSSGKTAASISPLLR
jgi:L-alanine-DL-glutamate epimerase-like enolase superfamily enzyme